MNVTGGLPLAGDNCSQETTGWNFILKLQTFVRLKHDCCMLTYGLVADILQRQCAKSPTSCSKCSQETTEWNFTERPSASGRPPSDINWSTYVIVAVEWITFVVGTVGNFVVLVVLAWRRSTSQVGTQLFVGSLAVADLGLMLSAVWLQAYAALQNGWPFSVISCKLKFTWQFLTLNSSIWTLAALSIDRYALYISASW